MPNTPAAPLSQLDRLKDLTRRDAEEQAKKAKRVADRKVITEQIEARQRANLIRLEAREQVGWSLSQKGIALPVIFVSSTWGWATVATEVCKAFLILTVARCILQQFDRPRWEVVIMPRGESKSRSCCK